MRSAARSLPVSGCAFLVLQDNGPAAACRPLRIARWIVLALACTFPSAAAPSLEWAIKAEYLLKLVPFVDWPQNAFASPGDPFRLCIVGQDPFGGLVEQAAQGQSMGQRPVSVVRLKAVAAADRCQLMYVAGDPQFVAQSLAAVSGSPVLTVTDAQGETKGIVNFVVLQNHVRFEIDRAAAAKSHLNLSSKLLTIAVPPAAGSTP